jgi:hypothetical protein
MGMVGLTKYARMRLRLSRFSEGTHIDNVRPSLAIVMYSWIILPLIIRDACLGGTDKHHQLGRDL